MSGGARDDAIKLVEDALKSGRIVQADHDMRVDQLRNAQTMQDVDLLVRDLRPAASPATASVAPTVAVGAGQAPAGGQPWPLVNYGPGSAQAAEVATAVQKSGKAIGGIIALIVIVSVVVPIAGAIIAFVSARDSFPDFGDIGPTDDSTYLPGQAPGEDGVNIFTEEGYTDLVDALEEESGNAYVFSASLFPRYAVLEVPTGTNDRYQYFYWDGRELELQDHRGSSTSTQIDMSLVEPRIMIELLETVRDRVDNPNSWYVVMSSFGAAGAQMTAYASNEFSESSYISATLDGTVVYDSDAP